MSKYEYSGNYFRITHTIEQSGPHITILYDFYENDFAITAIIQGEGTCNIEGGTYPLSDGDIIIMSPNDIHSFKFENNDYHERISLYMTSEMLSFLDEYELSFWQLFSTVSSQKNYLIKAKKHDLSQSASIFKQIIEIINSENIAMKDARIHLLILRLLFLLYDLKAQTVTDENGYTPNHIITEICTYIKEHLAEEISYDTLKKQFFISQYQLTVKFKEFVGMTLTEYIITKRLMRVISLVRTGKNIETAVCEAGFNTYSYFYKQFLKHFKLPPREYFSNSK